MYRKAGYLIVIICFLIMLYGLTLANLIVPDRSFSDKENRFLAEIPKFNINYFLSGKYSDDFDEYSTDQFVGRDWWTQSKAICEILLLKKDNNGVYFGRDGYLLGKYDNNDIDFEKLQDTMMIFQEFVQDCSRLLGKDRVSVMLVPMSSSILYNKLPAFSYGFNQDELVDEVYKRISQYSIVSDIRPELRDSANKYIYYKTDHHWTSLGAFLAYYKWCRTIGITPVSLKDFNINSVSDDFYGTYYSKANLYTIKPDTINVYIPKTRNNCTVTYNAGERIEKSLYNPKYLDKRDKYAFFLSGNNPLVEIDTQVKNNRRLLIIKDSFAHSFAPFAVQSFQYVSMIDLRYYNLPIGQYIKDNSITDVLVLYSTINFATDRSIYNLKLGNISSDNA